VTTHSTPVVPSGYHLGCPDVLAITFADRPQYDCLAAIDLDGRVPIGDIDRIHVEGLTLDEARIRIAHATGSSPDRVIVHLTDPRAARLYLHGPEQGRQRAVEYIGAERLNDALIRVGAMKPGCTDHRDVCVIRPNVAAGVRPEVFRVRLDASPQANDPTANVLLHPGDRIYVGETRRSSFSRLLPEFLKPIYRKLLGVVPPDVELW
jgi:protein involved in polysaccharide export with SLBB domain